jgi:hypothetical protein
MTKTIGCDSRGPIINCYRVRRSRLFTLIQTLSTAPVCRLLRIAELKLLLLDISVNERRVPISSDSTYAAALTPSTTLLHNLIATPARADEPHKLLKSMGEWAAM